MKRTVFVAVAISCTLVTSASAQEARDAKPVTMTQVMSSQELVATGISGLSPGQRAALDKWLQRYTGRISTMTTTESWVDPHPINPEVHRSCEQLCNMWRACPGKVVSDVCADECASNFRFFRAEAGVSFTQCLAAAGCNGNEDTCILSIPLLPAHLTYAQECSRRLEECGRDADDIRRWCDVEGNAWAARYRLYGQKSMNSAIACLRMSCDRMCIRGLPGYPLVRSDQGAERKLGAQRLGESAAEGSDSVTVERGP